MGPLLHFFGPFGAFFLSSVAFFGSGLGSKLFLEPAHLESWDTGHRTKLPLELGAPVKNSPKGPKKVQKRPKMWQNLKQKVRAVHPKPKLIVDIGRSQKSFRTGPQSE